MSAPDRRARLDLRHKTLSVRRQCALLGLARSGVYRAPAPAGEDDAAAMRRIDALYTEHPFYGSRRIAFELKMNRKRAAVDAADGDRRSGAEAQDEQASAGA